MRSPVWMGRRLAADQTLVEGEWRRSHFLPDREPRAEPGDLCSAAAATPLWSGFKRASADLLPRSDDFHFVTIVIRS